MSEQETAPDDKKQAETLKQIGNEFLGAGRLAEAIQCYSEAISLNNKNPVFYYNRAVAYDKMKQHDRAIKDCKQALKLDPLYSKAYGRMGLAATAVGDDENAAEYYREALERDPDNKEYMEKLEGVEKHIQEIAATSGLNFGEELPDLSSLFTSPAVQEKADELMKKKTLNWVMAHIMSGDSEKEREGIEGLAREGAQLVAIMEQENPQLVKQLRALHRQNRE